MSALANPSFRLTPEEYLTIERQAERKSELVNGRLVAMAGASRFHNRIKDNLVGNLFAPMVNSPCQSFSSDQRVYVESSGSYFYPDVVVACGQLQWQDQHGDVLLNPTVLIEVLSQSTALHDSVTKLGQYQSIPSLAEYVLVSQDEPMIVHYIREVDGSWRTKIIGGLDHSLDLRSVGISIPMSAIYDRIRFDGPEPELT